MMAISKVNEDTELVAGRELDALIAEHVMGWQRKAKGIMHGKSQVIFVDAQDNSYTIECGCVEDFNPSTDIAAAMEVVEKLYKRNILVSMFQAQCWNVAFDENEKCVGSDSADSLPKAICRAALQAIASS